MTRSNSAMDGYESSFMPSKLKTKNLEKRPVSILSQEVDVTLVRERSLSSK